jgi:hypothetical protein
MRAQTHRIQQLMHSGEQYEPVFSFRLQSGSSLGNTVFESIDRNLCHVNYDRQMAVLSTPLHQ